MKQAIDLVRKSRQGEATDVEGTISDPVARKLVEWVILHSEDGSPDFSRYAAFIAANPSWPGIETLRRRAEAVMWQQHIDPLAVIEFFPLRTAAHRQRPLRAGARAAHARRRCRRCGGGAPSLAQ